MQEMGRNSHDFMAYIHTGIPADKLDELINKGLAGCAFGVESSQEQFRNKVFKKGLSDKRLFESVNVLERRGIPYVAFYLTGFPGQEETMQEIEQFAGRVGGDRMIWQYEHLEVN
jgi:radical SAM superfamily enzyme YgiQ (UPF0313 family)